MSLTQTKKEYLGYILDGMARALWVNAYANWADNVVSTCIHCDQQIILHGAKGWVDENMGSADCPDSDAGHEPDGEMEDGPATPAAGGDWDDVAPATPYAAYLAAQALARLWAKAEDTSLPDLFEAAMMIDQGEFEWLPDESKLAIGTIDNGGRGNARFSAYVGKHPGVAGYGSSAKAAREDLLRKVGDLPTQADAALEFGSGIASESLGNGGSWFDHRKQERDGARLEFNTPTFECTYDGKKLSWSGGTGKTLIGSEQEAVYDADTGETTLTRLGRVTFLNPNDDVWKHSYLIAIGTSHVFFVRADNEGDALDEISDWVSENAPGLFSDDEVNDDYNTRIDNGEPEGEAIEKSEEGFIMAGNGHYFAAHEVHFLATDPSREQLFEIARVGEDLRINPHGEEWGAEGPQAFERELAVKAVVEGIPWLDALEPTVFSAASPDGAKYLDEYRTERADQVTIKDPANAVFIRLPKNVDDHMIRDLLKEVVEALNREWPLVGHVWKRPAWDWGNFGLVHLIQLVPEEMAQGTRHNPRARRARADRRPQEQRRIT